MLWFCYLRASLKCREKRLLRLFDGLANAEKCVYVAIAAVVPMVRVRMPASPHTWACATAGAAKARVETWLNIAD